MKSREDDPGQEGVGQLVHQGRVRVEVRDDVPHHGQAADEAALQVRGHLPALTLPGGVKKSHYLHYIIRLLLEK